MRVYRTKISNVNELKRRINRKWASVSRGHWTLSATGVSV